MDFEAWVRAGRPPFAYDSFEEWCRAGCPENKCIRIPKAKSGEWSDAHIRSLRIRLAKMGLDASWRGGKVWDYAEVFRPIVWPDIYQ
jgi:hypothetical protein